MTLIVNIKMIRIRIRIPQSELEVLQKLKQKCFVEHVLQTNAIGTMITYLVLILKVNIILGKNVE